MPIQYAGIYFVYVGRPEPQWLPQISLSSVTQLNHTASRTCLTQTFLNPSAVSPIKRAKYTFPLYESCAIVEFRCYVGTRLIKGIIKEKDDASATYQAAIERNEPASLLEQHTTDVFSTSIGNIPAGQSVKVEIEYIMELKHDAEADGLRFTIPTSIAPRYGTSLVELSREQATGVNISVQITMSSSIRSVQSPSHPISVYLGGHSIEASDAFNPQHALATLGQTTTELGKDFVLLVKCADLSSPTALLEEHPTIANSKALMVTLVPKFNFPRGTKPEVVFVVDRSGSMVPHVAPLKSSLSIFLKSLPVDVNFNICSFGSRHSFLWENSRPYSNQSFAEAQRYCDSIRADFGGTEIHPAIKSTVERRLKDLNLDIMVLTDGEVWNTETLFKYVDDATAKGDVRVFSLGIGRNVSHALVDGLARVGHGFSQVVLDENESMESKVTRMLRGGLSPHVFNYQLGWDGKPSVDMVKEVPAPTRGTRGISLFDARAEPDRPISFFDPPGFTTPSAIQAPYKIQPLFPFSRTSAYVILSSDVPSPSHVWLRGSTPEGDELELEIPVQKESVRGETIHQLAARKVLQELKDGTSYVHSAINKDSQPGSLAGWVKKEGVKVGLKYRVASEWTSFVAVEQKEEEQQGESSDMEPQQSELNDDEDWDTVMEVEPDDDSDNGVRHRRSSVIGGGRGRGRGQSIPVMMMMTPPPPPIPYPEKSKHMFGSMFGSSKSEKSAGSPSFGWTGTPSPASSVRTKRAHLGASPSPDLSSMASSSMSLIGNNPTGYSGDGRQFAMQQQQQRVSPTPMPVSQPASPHFSLPGQQVQQQLSSPPPNFFFSPPSVQSFGSSVPLSGPPVGAPLASPRKIRTGRGSTKNNMSSEINISYTPPSALPEERFSSNTGAQPLSSKIKSLIGLQTFEGYFVLNSSLASILGASIFDLESKLALVLPNMKANLSLEQRKNIWATVLAIKIFETQMAGEQNVWQLVVDKARVWMKGLLSDEEIAQLENGGSSFV